jgi:cytochrome P450
MDKNPIYRFGPPTFSWATAFSIEALAKRQAEIKEGAPREYEDFLDKFLETKKKHPELVDDNMVVTYLLSNVLAGSDTTAITLCAATYYVLKNPQVQRKLEKELDNANLEFPVSWKATQSLPYLEAVMLEAMRIHSGVGLMLERIVPSEGFTFPDGRYIPAGTIVGMNPWVIHRNEEVFGPDVETFRPERWLQYDDESEEGYEARKKKMKGANLAFGAGPRTCIGKFLSMLESYKLIATMFGMFDVSCYSPDFRGIKVL